MDNHVESKKSENNSSIFAIFDNLFNDNGKNSKHCLSLLNSVQGIEFSVGTSTNTQYSIKRLVRGLGSTRFNTQCACFAALTCLLKYHSIDIDELLKIVDKESTIEGASKIEEGFAQAGCLMTCGAIIHAGEFSNQTKEAQIGILERIIKSGKSRSYLTLLSYQFLIDAIDHSNFKNVLWPVYQIELKEGNAGKQTRNSSVDAGYFLLACYEKKPKIVSKFIDMNLNSLKSVIKNLMKILLNTSVQADHPIYDCISRILNNDQTILNPGLKVLNEDVKEESLIMFLLNMVKDVKDAATIPKLLTPKVIEILLKVLTFVKGKPVEENLKNGRLILDLIVQALNREDVGDDIRLETIKKLIFYPANLKFEKKTGSKCLQSITSQLKKEGVKELAGIYKKIINGELKKKVDAEENEEDWNSKEKQYALFMFVKLLNHPAMKAETSWKLLTIKYIFNVGYLKTVHVTSEVQKSAKDCFYKAIELQMPKLEDLVLLLDDLLMYVNDNVKNIKSVNQKAWGKMFMTVQKLKDKKNKKLFIAVHLLLIYMGFQLLTSNDVAENSIEELISCYSHLKKSHDKNENDSEEPHWTEVTVDLILSLLSRESKLYRYVVSCVFPQVVAYMTPSALHQIISSLDPRSDSKILGHADSDSEEEEEEDDEDDDDEENDEDDDTASSLTEEEDEEKISDQLRVAVRNALGKSAAAGSDDESVDMDAMDEEEEKRLNSNLAAAFQLFRANSNDKKKKKQSKEDETLMHFRLRVLDLLEIYITNNPSMNGCLDIILPVFELYEFSVKDVHQKPLQNRIETVLKKLAAVKKFSDQDEVTKQTIVDVFQGLMGRKEVSGLMFVEMAPKISDCCAFLAKCSQLIDCSDALVKGYVALLRNFFQGKDNRLPASIFQSILRINWSGNWKIVGVLFEILSDSNIRIFKKKIAIDMLMNFYRNEKLHSSADNEIKKEFNRIESDFAKKLADYLQKDEKIRTKSSENMSLNFFTKILNLIKIAYQSFKRNRGDYKIPPWKNVIVEMIKINSIMDNNQSRQLVSKIGELLGVTVPKLEKRKRTISNSSIKSDASESEGVEKSVKDKKKKKWSVEKVQLKKEAKKLRENASSAGLEVVSFSAVNCDSLPEPEIQEEEDDGVKSKKRKSDEAIVNGNGSVVKKNKSKKLKT